MLATPLAAAPQQAATVPAGDPIYGDLALLDAFGLLPEGLPARRPLSVARIRRLVDAARRQAGLAPGADVSALLRRLQARLGDPDRRAALRVDAEAGAGESPGRAVPDNGVGAVDAVLNPLWMGQGGRSFGDRATLAGAARASVSPLPWLAAGVGARASRTRNTGVPLRRRGATVEAAYLRVVAGALALEVGRDDAAWLSGGLLLSGAGPPLDAVRLSTERPLPLHLLGDTEFQLLAADLRAAHDFPHAKLFGARLTARPVRSVRLGLSLLNKQGGDGGPAASLGDRLKDLTFVWDLFRRDADYRFSDKQAGVDVEVHLPARGVRLYAEAALADFDTERIQDTFVDDAAYRVGLALRRLGASQRHGLDVEAARVGPLAYRHHQYISGHTLDGYLLGSALGPDGRSVRLGYRYDAPAPGWRLDLDGFVEARRADRYRSRRERGDPPITRLEVLPAETRLRLEARWRRALADGRGGVEVRAGLERVRGFAFQEGARRTNRAILVRMWWGG